MHKKIFFFITIFSIASCITYREIEFIDVHSISFSKENGCSPICADLKVYNPNRYSISIKDLDVEARLNGKKIGKGVTYYDSLELLKILGKKTSEIKKSLGYDGRNEIVHRDYLTLNE